MKCPKCETESDSKFCPNCGANLQKESRDAECVNSNINQGYSMTNPPKKSERSGGCLKIVLIVLAVFFVLWIIGSLFGSDDNDSKNDNDKVATSESVNSEQEAETKTDNLVKNNDKTEIDNLIDADIKDCHVKYVSSEILTNYVDEECLVVYFEFTNNSDENKSFDYAIGAKAFQNGVELKSSNFHVNDESKDSEMDIQPGTTITVASAFIPRDNSTVTLQVGKWLFDKPVDEMTLEMP